jgi:hypothetical protein
MTQLLVLGEGIGTVIDVSRYIGIFLWELSNPKAA